MCRQAVTYLYHSLDANLRPSASAVDDVLIFAALDIYQKGDGDAPVPHGLRACAFALLSLLHRLDGDDEGEAAYSSWALHSVDAVMSCGERPSEQLISALVLLELSLVHAGRLEGTLSGLAHHLAGFIPTACTEAAFCAGIFHKQGIFARCGVVWPPKEAPVGASRAWRLADLLSFAAAHLSGAVAINHETAVSSVGRAAECAPKLHCEHSGSYAPCHLFQCSPHTLLFLTKQRLSSTN